MASDQYLAEIRIFPFNFAPLGWAQCNGQLVAIAANPALFSLIGTYYGGDGKSNFALPNFAGRAAIDQGQGNGLSNRTLGQPGGEPSVTLLTAQIPNHSHNANASTQSGVSASPTNNVWGAPGAGRGLVWYSIPGNINTPMAGGALSLTGNNLPHNNLMPYLTLNFCIATQGIFPPRN